MRQSYPQHVRHCGREPMARACAGGRGKISSEILLSFNTKPLSPPRMPFLLPQRRHVHTYIRTLGFLPQNLWLLSLASSSQLLYPHGGLEIGVPAQVTLHGQSQTHRDNRCPVSAIEAVRNRGGITERWLFCLPTLALRKCFWPLLSFSASRGGWTQVFHTALRKLSNTWAKCNIFTVDVHLEGRFKAALSQTCGGTGKGFLDSQCTVSEENIIISLDIK